MPFNLTEHDRNLLDQLSMKPAPGSPEPVSGYPFRGGEIPFQFPPRIKSDVKTGNWETIDVKEWEPQIIFWGANARSITLEITMVATGHEYKGVTWDTDTISKIVKNLRGILYSNTKGSNLPVWELTLYQHIPESGQKSTWRTISTSEAPGDTFITINGFTYSFKTVVTLQLEMVTQIQKQDKKHQNIGNIPPKPEQDWY